MPDFPGRDTFEGRLVHTGAWPEDLDITGKRVGVIGTGSTGTQFITAAAQIAAHLTVVPAHPAVQRAAGNRPVDQAEVDQHQARTSTRSGTRSATPSSPSGSRRAPSRR